MTDYATRIAETIPLPTAHPALRAAIAAYGAECARQGYALGYGVSK